MIFLPLAASLIFASSGFLFGRRQKKIKRAARKRGRLERKVSELESMVCLLDEELKECVEVTKNMANELLNAKKDLMIAHLRLDALSEMAFEEGERQRVIFGPPQSKGHKLLN